MSQPPRNKPPARQVPTRTSRPASGAGASGRPDRGAPPPRNPGYPRPRYSGPPPQQRDPFPYIMGGIIGALVVGLMLVIFLLVNNSNSNNNVANTNTNTGTNTNTDTAAQNPTAAADEPPRMPIEEFKKLYDDPAKRPLIIDVRAQQSYDEGHIQGAIAFPEADVDARVSELPKDKLIIAYCQ